MIKRDAFLYMEPSGNVPNYGQCGTCMMWTGSTGPNPLRCHIHGKALEAPAGASCGIYVHGKPMPKGPIMKLVTPEESGLVVKQVRCENCRYFKAVGSVCTLFQQLNALVYFDLDEKVKAKGCCNAFESGSEAGAKRRAQLKVIKGGRYARP